MCEQLEEHVLLREQVQRFPTLFYICHVFMVLCSMVLCSMVLCSMSSVLQPPLLTHDLFPGSLVLWFPGLVSMCFSPPEGALVLNVPVQRVLPSGPSWVGNRCTRGFCCGSEPLGTQRRENLLLKVYYINTAVCSLCFSALPSTLHTFTIFMFTNVTVNLK